MCVGISMGKHVLYDGLTLLSVFFIMVGVAVVGVSRLDLGLSQWIPILILLLFGTLSFLLVAVQVLIKSVLAHRIKNRFLIQRLRFFLLTVFPVLYLIKPLFKDRFILIERDLIVLNNLLVMALSLKVDPHKILMLAPHCLQSSTCSVKVTSSVLACKECGLCQIADLKAMAHNIGFHLFVATGGTLARQTIGVIKPALVIAVACERDLVSGIIDMKHLITFGVLNDKPKGPCVDTCMDLERMRGALTHFIAQ